MMGTCADSDIVRVTAKMSYSTGAGQVQNVYHCILYLPTGPAADSVVHDAIAGALDTAYTYLNTQIRNSLLYDTIETWNVTQDRPMVEADWPVLAAGEASADDPGAPQVAPLVKFTTPAARSQGRKFLPPVIETAINNFGTVTSTLQGFMASYALELLGYIPITDFGTLQFGNYSKTYSRFAPWVNAIVSVIARTQRRRVRGVGT
jgi:hypothetical protein